MKVLRIKRKGSKNLAILWKSRRMQWRQISKWRFDVMDPSSIPLYHTVCWCLSISYVYNTIKFLWITDVIRGWLESFHNNNNNNNNNKNNNDNNNDNNNNNNNNNHCKKTNKKIMTPYKSIQGQKALLWIITSNWMKTMCEKHGILNPHGWCMEVYLLPHCGEVSPRLGSTTVLDWKGYQCNTAWAQPPKGTERVMNFCQLY